MIQLTSSIWKAGKPLLFPAIFFVTAISLTQCKTTSPPNRSHTMIDDERWDSIDRLNELGRPQSALPLVEEALSLATQANDLASYYRSLIYLQDILRDTEDPGLESAIKRLENETAQRSGAEKAVAEALLSMLYSQYLEENRWRILDRGRGGELPTDLSTWTIYDFVKRITQGFDLALEETNVLQTVDLGDFAAGLSNQAPAADRALRPTLYDVMAHRALEFYQSAESGLTQPMQVFKMGAPQFFDPTEAFVKLEITTPDSLDYHYKAIRLFQQVSRFHLERDDLQATLQLELDRLDFVARECSLPNAKELHREALTQLMLRAGNDPMAASVSYSLANWYAEQAPGRNDLESFVGEQERDGGAPGKLNASANPLLTYRLKAEEIAIDAIDRWPGSFGAISCESLLQKLRFPEMELAAEAAILPDREALFEIEYRNTPNASFRLLLMTEELTETLDQTEDYSERIKRLCKEPAFRDWQEKLPAAADHNHHAAEAALPALPLGSYTLLACFDGKFDPEASVINMLDFQVTRMALISTTREYGGMDLFVLDRENGSALQDVTIDVFKRRYDYNTRTTLNEKVDTRLSEKNGAFKLSGSGEYQSVSLVLRKGADEFRLDNALYIPTINRSVSSRDQTRSFLFSDRSIYRPGQPIYVKGILLNEKENTPSAPVRQIKTTVVLKNVHGDIVASQPVQTNDLGSYFVTFNTPSAGLTGTLMIQDEYGAINVQVEEYKRPKFEVVLAPPKGEIKLGDNITIQATARAYTGMPLGGSQVSYRVFREEFWPWWCYGYFRGDLRPGGRGSASQEIANGTSTVAKDGSFSLAFLAQAPEAENKNRWFEPQYRFIISADVTDPSGETRTGEQTLLLTRAAFRLELDPLEAVWVGEKLPAIRVQTLNASDQPVPVELTARLIAVEPTGRRLRDRLWSSPDQFLYSKDEFGNRFPHDPYGETENPANRKSTRVLWEQTIKPGQTEISLPKNPTWPSGEYALFIFGEDQDGNSVGVEHYLRLQYNRETTVPGEVYLFADGPGNSIQPGQELKLRMGSGVSNAHILYELRRGKETLAREWLNPGASIDQRTHPVEEADRGGLEIEITTVLDNRLHQITRRIDVPWSNKDLSVEWERFRDHMEPGDNERWTLRIRGEQGEAVAAEMLISMYDASLDALMPHAWNTWKFPQNTRWRNWTGLGFELQNSEMIEYNYTDWVSPPTRQYDQLFTGRYGLLDYYEYGFRGGRGDVEMMFDKASPVMNGLASAKAPAIEKNESDNREKTSTAAPAASAPPLRTDFRETAFFFPQLRADDKGSVSFSFVAPESLTRWHIMGLAHDTNLRLGILDDTAITSKKLMVTPNFPRFLREGDRMVLSARIDNASDKALSGVAELLLFDVITGRPVDGLFGHMTVPVEWTAEGGASAVASWLIVVPRAIGAIRYEVKASSGAFTDGEANMLPVLSRRMLVSETFAFSVPDQGTYNLEWERLLEEADRSENQRLSLEFTPNPAWYAVQALPYLMEFPHECSEQVFSRFYANQIGSWLAESDPAIAQVFEQWKGTDALTSNLEKNQDLKSLLIEETPWLRDARDETERKQRLGILLDADRMRYESVAALDQLLQAQSPNGGWPWFPGGQDNPYITRHIVAGLGHLSALGVTQIRNDNAIWSALAQAVNYLDARAIEKWVVKESKLVREPDNEDLHYLYTRSFFPELGIPGNLENAFGLVLNTAAANWNDRSIFEQALLALAIQRWKTSLPASEINENTRLVPQQIMTSLKERSQRSDELGMWWPQNSRGYYWHQAPIETQALLIEAFSQVARDEESVEAMKSWLLSQKRTRSWESTKATAEACYALLATGQPLLSTRKSAAIYLDGQLIESDEAEAGTGYFRRDWSPSEIRSGQAKLRIEKNNPGMAWGGMYWSYFEDLDKVSESGGSLSVQKQLFREQAGERGPELVAIQANDPTKLSVGETMVTRLIITTDRDLEYVHVKDSRAAGLEPMDVLSGYQWSNGLGFYRTVRDASSHFFMDFLPRGTWVVEYSSRAFQPGEFSSGPALVECMYAPEFSSLSAGGRLKIQSAAAD